MAEIAVHLVEIGSGQTGRTRCAKARLTIDGDARSLCANVGLWFDLAVRPRRTTAFRAVGRCGTSVEPLAVESWMFAGPELVTEDTPVTESYADRACGKVICE